MGNGSKKKKRVRRKAVYLIEKVSANVAKYRLLKKFSVEQLEDLTNLNIVRCESGKYDMNLTTIDILSKYLDVAPTQLLE